MTSHITPTEQMREAVARAIYATLDGPISNQDFGRQTAQWDLSLSLADAAIRAIPITQVSQGWSDTARQMLAAHDLFMSGAGVTPTQKADADRLVLPACFAAEAYDRLGGGEEGTMALLRAFLLAVIDPASPELDYLRAGALPAAPLTGEGA